MTPTVDRGLRPEHAYILGGGRFGSRAYRFLRPDFLPSNLTMVDSEQTALAGVLAAGGRAVCADALEFLAASQARMAPHAWIIPAIPVHVAWAWLQKMLSPALCVKAMPVPRDLQRLLPNAMPGAAGELYVSHAYFRCPDTCPEPDERCTVTGEPRPEALHDMLARLTLPGYRSVCIASNQLGPGVGGYRVQALRKALETVRDNPGRYLVSTACKCHGVVHAFDCRPA